MMSALWPFFAVVVLLAFSGFFSGSETALTAASRARMHALEKEGDKRAARVNRLLSDRESLIGAILLGNNLVNILASSLSTAVFMQWFGNAGVPVATAFMVVLVLVFAEVLPKTYAISNADNTAMGVSRPISWLVSGLAWIVKIIQFIVQITLQVFGIRAGEGMVSAEEEIRGTIDLHHSEGGVETVDRHMLVGALDLKDLTVADLMIHRKSINMIDIEQKPREIVMEALSSPHTRLPLYRGSQDEIVGILHAKDLLRAIAPLRGDLDQLDVEGLLREPWFVPETLTVQEQLDAFLKERSHFALVVDEYGALEGLITLEDILEEIVGDIRDEHDVVVQGVRQQPDGSVNVDGVVTIRDINRAMGWNLPDDEAVTIAGLVIHEAQTIPEPGQRFSFHGYQFDVLRKSRNQITALRVKRDEEV